MISLGLDTGAVAGHAWPRPSKGGNHGNRATAHHCVRYPSHWSTQWNIYSPIAHLAAFLPNPEARVGGSKMNDSNAKQKLAQR